MKKIIVFLTTVLVSLPIYAMSMDSGLLTMEEVVSTVLQSSELKAEKDNNVYLKSLSLKSIDIESVDGETVVNLQYDKMTGGASCGVIANVKAVSTVPEGAVGVNMVAKITRIYSACALD